MNRSILDLYVEGSASTINKSTIKALKDRNLLNDNNSLSELGKRYAISKMSLQHQCSELSLELKVVDLEYTGKPEHALLEHFKTLGYIGSSQEGAGILTVLKALMLDKLAEYNIFNDRSDACSRYLEAQLSSLKDRAYEIISSITVTSEERFKHNFRQILTQPFVASEYPGLSLEFGMSMYHAIDTKVYVALAKLIVSDPYTYRSGWPDLTLIKGNSVLFVEVKTTDKLHDSQIATISAVRDILPYNFMIYKVRKAL